MLFFLEQGREKANRLESLKLGRTKKSIKPIVSKMIYFKPHCNTIGMFLVRQIFSDLDICKIYLDTRYFGAIFLTVLPSKL